MQVFVDHDNILKPAELTSDEVDKLLEKSPEEIKAEMDAHNRSQIREAAQNQADAILASDEVARKKAANARSQKVQLDWVHSHSGRNRDGSRWGFIPNAAGGNAILLRAVQQWQAAGNLEEPSELTYDMIDRAAISLYEEGALPSWIDDGIHSIYARFVRDQELAPALSEEEKQQYRERTRKILEDQAEKMPLDKLREKANEYLVEQAAGQPDRGSMWGDRSQRGDHSSNMPLNRGWRPASLDGTFEPSEE